MKARESSILRSFKNSVMFRDLSDEDIQRIKNITIEKSYSKGEVVFTEGSKSTGFFLVISGKVKVFKRSETGKEHILHIIYPSETFAEASIFSGNFFPANAEAIEETKLLYFPKEPFVSFIEKNPRFAMAIIASFSMVLRQFNSMIEELSLKEVPARLAKYLLTFPEKQVLTDGSIIIELPFSKSDLASYLGTINETLSRSLKKLRENGIIRTDRKRIIIPNKEILIRIAEGEKL